MIIGNNGKEYKSVGDMLNDWDNPNKEVLKELIEATLVSIDLHGIDYKKEYPNLSAELQKLRKE